MKLCHRLAPLTLIAATCLTAFAGSYTLDPVHSTAIFRIKHMGATYVYGRINAPEGTVEYDPAKPEASSFNITLKTENVDTNNKQRDEHLKSPTFFNATDFPDLTFKSTAVKKIDAEHLEVTGDLTIHGVTKSITVNLEHTGSGNMQGKSIEGFETAFDIKRSDYGMKQMIGPVGDDVHIIVSFEADKK